MFRKKFCLSAIISLMIIVICSFSVNAASKTYSDEQKGTLAFNDYGWVVMNCLGKDTETYSIGTNCNIKRTSRSQFARISASRTDMPSFSPVMTNITYVDANDNVKKSFTMTNQAYYADPAWVFSACRQNNTTSVTYDRSVKLYSKFQVNVSAGGSLWAGWVYNFKFKINE